MSSSYFLHQFDSATIEQQVLMSNIKQFSTEKDDASLNLKHNIWEAFPIKRTNKHGDVTLTFNSQSLQGSSIPTVKTTNTNQVNVLTPVKSVKKLDMKNLGYEILFDNNQIEDGEISSQKAIETGVLQLNRIAQNLILQGRAYDPNQKVSLALGNNLIDIAEQKAGVDFNNTSAQEICKMFLNMKLDAEKDKMGVCDTIVMSQLAYSSAGLATLQGSNALKVGDWLKQAGFTIYVTDVLDNVQNHGAVVVMFKKSDDILQLGIGKEVNSRNLYNDNHTQRILLQMTIGGIINVTDSKSCIQVRSGLLG